MKFERFTDRARRVIVIAMDAAHRDNEATCGVPHLLYAMAAEADGLAGQSLITVGATTERIAVWMRSGTEFDPAAVPEGFKPGGGHLGFTDDAKKVLELSLRESLALEAGYIGTEHLLAGWLRWAVGTARKAAS